jgi:hypothetical protein
MLSPLCFITVVQRLGKSCIPVWTPSLLMRPITQVTSLDTSSMLRKRFPRSGFFNFGNKSKSGELSPPDFDLLSGQSGKRLSVPSRGRALFFSAACIPIPFQISTGSSFPAVKVLGSDKISYLHLVPKKQTAAVPAQES